MTATAAQHAAERFRRDEPAPAFFADWVNVLFIHFAVDAAALQPSVPFDLDKHQGQAFVSLVLFDAQCVRPCFGGPVLRAACRRIAEHSFLNVRTYVRVADEPGIYFLTEWVDGRLDALLGPVTYGLPYRRALITRQHHAHGCVTDPHQRRVTCDATPLTSLAAQPCARDSRDAFLLERYTAFTSWRGLRRRFRIWHEPWRCVPMRATVDDEQLLARHGRWFHSATMACAHHARGVHDVWIGRPRFIRPKRGAA